MAPSSAKRPAASELAGSARVVVSRVVSAKRELVYELWTDASRMPKWILDGGSATLDLRVGGKYHMDMHYKGNSYEHTGEYLELVPPERLVFTWISAATNGKPSIVTIELRDLGAKTEIVLTHEGLPDASLADHEGGWNEVLGWLEERML